MRGTADASPWAVPRKIQAAQEDVSNLGAAVCAKAEELSREVCQGDVGLGVERQAQSLGLGCCLGETLLSSGSCPAHSVLGLLAEDPCLRLLEETLLVEKTCQAPPAPSLPFAWCSPLGSVADTEDFFVMLFSFFLPEGQKRPGWRQAALRRWLVNREERARHQRAGHSPWPGPEQEARAPPAIFAQG